MTQPHKTKLLSGVRPISPPRDEVTLAKLLAAIKEWGRQEADATEPITISIAKTCRMTGYGPTTIWRSKSCALKA
jgi:hypothetical protein